MAKQIQATKIKSDLLLLNIPVRAIGESSMWPGSLGLYGRNRNGPRSESSRCRAPGPARYVSEEPQTSRPRWRWKPGAARRPPAMSRHQSRECGTRGAAIIPWRAEVRRLGLPLPA
jgi:hypothetical protein